MEELRLQVRKEKDPSDAYEADEFQVYKDPCDGARWIYVKSTGGYTKDFVALALHDLLVSRMARPARPMLPCQHSESMFNGMPWETDQSVGMTIHKYNWVQMSYQIARGLTQRLFENTHPGQDGSEFEGRLVASGEQFGWAVMNTHKGKYLGLLSKCRHCDKLCRVAWLPAGAYCPSTPHHMQLQRALICSWLKIGHRMPEPPGAPDSLPNV